MNKSLLFIVTATAILAAAFMFVSQRPHVSKQEVTKVPSYFEYLADLAEEVNSMQTTWKATPHQKRWENMNYESIKRLNGALETPEHLLKQFRVESSEATNIPESFNSTE